MNYKKVFYIDLEKVSSQISDTINVEHYGEILFRKKKLSSYHEVSYNSLNKYDFQTINSYSDLNKAIDSVEFSDDKFFLIHISKFVVVNQDNFKLFLEKINYVPESLAVCEFDKILGLLKLNQEQTLYFLNLLKNNNTEETLNQFNPNKKIERFNLETFHIQINSYPDLIKMFQSSFELRYFNAIEKKENTITKKSTDKKKMFAEYSYYSHLNDAMRFYFLPTFGFSENEETAQYSLERLKVPDVALQWIHFSLNDKEFEILVKKLFDFIKTRSTKEIPQEEFKKKTEDLYIDKVMERFDKLANHEKFAQINQFLISTTGLTDLRSVYEDYKSLFHDNSKKIFASKTLALNHGDLCFSNMLYDKRIELLKLIDPKGAAKEEDLYIHPYYDIAKLSHSILGKYDFINNGLYGFNFDENLKSSLTIHNAELLTSKEEIFKKVLHENGFDSKLVRLFEASLFLSMLPLHIDNPKKVTAFFLNAQKIISEIKNTP
jgi:hypothetical protein